MGAESGCTARFGGRVSDGRVWLETDELVFRGSFKLVIPYREMKAVHADGGKLFVECADGDVVLEVGNCAEDWADKILHPKLLVDKLGVKPDHRVALIGVAADFLGKRLKTRPTTRARRDHDLIFLAVEKSADLEHIAGVVAALKPDGALWTVRPRGKKEVAESLVREAARAAGLVDVKVARFSATHTAEKFVRPRARRQGG